MTPGIVLLLAFAIGIVTGLRSMTAPAAVAWAARLGWLHLQGTPLSFMGSTVAVAIFTLFALAELADGCRCGHRRWSIACPWRTARSGGRCTGRLRRLSGPHTPCKIAQRPRHRRGLRRRRSSHCRSIFHHLTLLAAAHHISFASPRGFRNPLSMPMLPVVLWI